MKLKIRGGAVDHRGVPQVTLSIDQFENLCRGLKVPEPKAGERRGLVRVEVRGPVTVAVLENGEVQGQLQSNLRDISPGGATLNHPTPLKPGSFLVFYVESIRLLMKVVHCKCFRDGSAMLGLEIQGVLDSAERKAG